MITPGFCPGRANTVLPGMVLVLDLKCWRISSACPSSFCHCHQWGLFLRHASQRTTLPTSGFWGKGGGFYVPDCYCQAALGHLDGFGAGSEPGPSGEQAVRDGGAALHSSGRRAPQAGSGGERHPSGSLYIPDHPQPSHCDSSQPSPAPLCHKDDFSIYSHFSAPRYPASPPSQSSSSNTAARGKACTRTVAWFGELGAASSRYRNSRVK